MQKLDTDELQGLKSSNIIREMKSMKWWWGGMFGMRGDSEKFVQLF